MKASLLFFFVRFLDPSAQSLCASVFLFVCNTFFSQNQFFLFLDTGQEVKVPRVSKVTEHICLGKMQILGKILKRSKMALKQGYGQKLKIAVDQSNLSIL